MPPPNISTAARVGEVAVHAVVLQLGRSRRAPRPGPCTFLSGLALDQHVAAELAGEHDQRAVEQAALLEVEHELRDGRVDRLSSCSTSRVWPFSCVSQFRNGMYSVVTSMKRAPDLGQPPRQQAAQAEAADVAS